MQKVTVELMPRQAELLVEQLVSRLDDRAKMRLAEKLERQTRQARWEPLIQKMRERYRSRPLSAREIRRLCEQVRQERFDRAQGRR